MNTGFSISIYEKEEECRGRKIIEEGRLLRKEEYRGRRMSRWKNVEVEECRGGRMSMWKNVEVEECRGRERMRVGRID